MAQGSGTEAHILEGCRAGDPSAARDLVLRHQDTLFRVAGRLVGRWDAAEEIVQEAFVKAFAHIAQIDPQRGALGWLLRVVINLSRNWLQHTHQREQPQAIAPEAEPIFTGATPEPETTLIAAERRKRLAWALEQLPAPQREVVVLHYIEDLPFDVMAAAIGTPAAALRMRALRARANLRTLLKGESP